ncbi:modification methylase Sau96I [Gottschalkia acidurici 9a]|uniref:Cytosine-specific methyltransferase n=1 Tax=Gottschalkia acidurici (strain ATCC 7906 / DSM 604 / BCRC 14475 / CIP 104303 / KCTC 5404 / NCIMB 10678 / 9a) TaxID=1128398 RepID=K0AVK4_GOTA9|nr:DNA (cytosine-5-)-methyltransferase [Gottschalkia acidurici]AFS77873.1 modification methylase Sau96I [Gottschalkia acidurici 9a]
MLDKEKIRDIMEKKGIKTQVELSEKMGITKNQLSVILSEKFDPIKSNVRTLCEVLEVNIQEILSNENQAIQNKNQVKQLTMDINDIQFIDTSTIKPTRNFTGIELFAGAGGLALGLEKAGFRTLGLVEIDRFASETLRKNRPHWNVIEKDIVKVSEDGIRKYIDNDIEIDLLSGGYPCQTFSYAGNKKGLEDTRGTMFYYYAQILDQLKPKVFLAENVKGLVSHDNGRTLQTMIDVFSELGYKIQWKVLKALDYGVAQKRERIVIVGIRKDIDIEYKFPKPYEYKPVLKDALKDVPISDGAKYPSKKKAVLDLVPPGGYWRDLPEEIAKEYMGKSYYSGGGRTGMARRISWDEPCLTLTCSPAQKQTERCHPDETRPFRVREYARIQSFPDEWEFHGSTNQQYKQIGNAVPVELAKAVGLSIIDFLNKI